MRHIASHRRLCVAIVFLCVELGGVSSALADADCDLLIRVCGELRKTDELCTKSRGMVARYRDKGESPSALSLANERDNCALFEKSAGHFKIMRRRVEDADCLQRCLTMLEGTSFAAGAPKQSQ